MSALTNFAVAIQFLTISPAFIKRPFTAREMGHATSFFPLVGLLLGGVLLGLNTLFDLAFPDMVRAALTLAAWVILTGALHLDGFLDTCDGLLGGFTPEKRLEIMHDERVGGYALSGGALLMLVKFACLSALPVLSPALLVAPVLGRWGMTLAIIAFPYARPQGLGSDMKANAGRRQLMLATLLAVFSVVIAIAAIPTGSSGGWIVPAALTLAALTACGAVVWLGARFTLKRIPGLTGDIYGALNELVEVAVLLLFVAWV